MTTEIENLAERVLDLTPPTRAYLAQMLLESLEVEKDFSWSVEWQREISQCCQQIIRHLPAASVLPVIDLANIEFDGSSRNPGDPWDTLLTQPAAKHRLQELAREAIAEDLNGGTTEIGVTRDGRLAPA